MPDAASVIVSPGDTYRQVTRDRVGACGTGVSAG
jgi:hypothetical protein